MNGPSLPWMKIGSHSAPVIPDVLQEHLEEVAFLSIQRRKLLFSPDISLSQLLGHEGRVAAQWDGLVLGGVASVQMAVDQLEAFDPWETYAAARVWMELGAPGTVEVTERLDLADEDYIPAWREALSRMRGDRLGQLLPPDGVGGATAKALGMLAYAWGWRGLLPEESVPAFGFSSDPGLRRSTARALGWGAAPRQVQKLLPALLTDPDPAVMRAALWSLVLLDPASGVAAARSQLRSGSPDPFSARVLGLLGGPGDREVLFGLVAHAGMGPACALALGELGEPAAMEFLIDLLDEEDEELAGAARQAIEIMLGTIPSPEEGNPVDSKAGGSNSPSVGGEETGPDPGEGLEEGEIAGPEAGEVRKAWTEMAPGYEGSNRWLRGYPFPWTGPPGEESMESIWRSSLAAPRPEAPWLRNEVPDGFFSCTPDSEAVPGE